MSTMKTTLASLFRRLPVFLAFAASALAQGAAQVPPTKFDESQAKPYRITRQDQIGVQVFGEPDLNSVNNRVENVGTITLPLIKEIRLTGLTVLEAQEKIAKAYIDGGFLRRPEVKVTIEIYAPRQVMINGKIKSPGKHDLPPDRTMTLKEMIFQAGGFEETAAGTRVRITRTNADGSISYFEKDVQSAITAKKSSTNGDAEFVLEPDDVIYVPEKLI